jgi:outer membrane receptor protein involved in Fe transport
VDKFAAPAYRGEFHHFDAFATLDASMFLTVSERAEFSLTVNNAFNRIGQEYYGIIVPNSINDALGRRFAASLTLTL